MSRELLFEIGTEEIPAGYIIPALENLKENMAAKLAELNLSFDNIKGVATPRRLAICVEQLDAYQPDKVEELLGPPKQAAYDKEGNPTKAASGFAKSKGASLDDIQIISTPKGEYLMIVQEKKGRQTEELLPELLPELVSAIPFPKSMRWGAGRLTFARPIQWLLAVYNSKPLQFSIEGAGDAGSTTQGHRFMSPVTIDVTDFGEYLAKLRDNNVIADLNERKSAVVAGINAAAAGAKGHILPDEELVGTVANLVEKPFAICGSFDPKFLALPKEVLITSMREHQKYFAVTDQEGALMANFVAVNNTQVKDEQLGAEGHQRVLRARLEDAMFFFKDDQQKKLADFGAGLSGIVFQAKLGTMLEKTERISKLAASLAKELAPENMESAKRAATLAKADLLSAMVNEFPSLQGVMGRDYAIRDGEKSIVATAIQEHYMPIRAGSPLPKSAVGALVSMSDRLDTIAGCFGIGQVPTGTTDPFGLRRLALGLIHIIEDQVFSVSLSQVCRESLHLFGDKLTEQEDSSLKNIIDFIMGRYVNDQISKGVAAETVEAVTSVGFDDIVDCNMKIEALNAVCSQDSFALLAGSFKRVMNIVKDHQEAAIDEALFEEEAEKSLFAAYGSVNEEAAPLIKTREYEKAMQSILKMKEPIDHFFDDVMVMADDEKLKTNRLSLLNAIAALFLQIGDFSKMYSISK
jgi:glycyl-tRNA synthetase beta chain